VRYAYGPVTCKISKLIIRLTNSSNV